MTTSSKQEDSAKREAEITSGNAAAIVTRSRVRFQSKNLPRRHGGALPHKVMAATPLPFKYMPLP